MATLTCLATLTAASTAASATTRAVGLVGAAVHRGPILVDDVPFVDLDGVNVDLLGAETLLRGGVGLQQLATLLVGVGRPVLLRGLDGRLDLDEVLGLLGLREVGEVDVRAVLVVGVERDAVDGKRFAHPHVDVLAVMTLDAAQQLSLVAQEVAGDPRRDRELHLVHAGHVEHRRQVAERVDRHRVGLLHQAASAAGRAVGEVRALVTGTHPLTRHLENAELRDLQDRRLGAVPLHPLLEAVLDVLAVLGPPHVDQVVDDDAAHVAQAELAADLVDGLDVRLVGVGLGVAALAALAAVDVDGHERLGLIDDQPPAAGQGHLAGVDERDLAFDVEGVEDGALAGVLQELGRAAGRDDLHEPRGPLHRDLVVDDDLADLVGQHVAERADQKVALAVEQARLAARALATLHVLPQPLQVRQVALEIGLGAVHPRRAEDEAEALGQLELVEDLPHLAPLLLVLHLARHPHLVHVGHHHEEPTGNREVARERRALGAHALLEHLHDHLVAATQRLLDQRPLATRGLEAHPLGRLLALAREVPGVQVRDVQEAVFAKAKVDEGRLNRGLHVHDLADVDVPHAARRGELLVVELLEAAVLDDRHPALLAGDVVDQHLGFWHRSFLPRVDARLHRTPRLSRCAQVTDAGMEGLVPDPAPLLERSPIAARDARPSCAPLAWPVAVPRTSRRQLARLAATRPSIRPSGDAVRHIASEAGIGRRGRVLPVPGGPTAVRSTP